MSRYFFVGIGSFCVLLALIGFGPGVHAFTVGGGTIPPIVHVHGVAMLAWLLLFTLQASLVRTRRLDRHRQLGWTMTGLAALVWMSMIVTTVVALQRFDPQHYGFLVQPLLIQTGSIVLFPMFFAWALLARHRADWHKRMVCFATFTLMQAALDRMHWLPDSGLTMFWNHGVRMYVLLILPLVVFDLSVLRRIHPATWVGIVTTVVMHAVASHYWDHAGWQRLAREFWMWLRL